MKRSDTLLLLWLIGICFGIVAVLYPLEDWISNKFIGMMCFGFIFSICVLSLWMSYAEISRELKYTWMVMVMIVMLLFILFWPELPSLVNRALVGMFLGGWAAMIAGYFLIGYQHYIEQRREWSVTVPEVYEFAKNLASEGDASLLKGAHDKALFFYDQAFKSFSQAKTLALKLGRNSPVPISELREWLDRCEKNIHECESMLDREKISRAQSEAIRLLNAADTLIRKGNLSEALIHLNDAKNEINGAIKIAEKRMFKDIVEKIEKIKATIESRISDVEKLL